MTQNNPGTAQIRVVLKCAKGMVSSVAGQTAESNPRSSRHIRT